MISGGGWQQLGGCNCRQQHRYNGYRALRLGFLRLSPSMLTKPSSLCLIADNCCRHRRSQLHQRMASSSSFSKSPGQIPILADSSSQPEERRKLSAGRLSSVAGGVVALGKFDALHIGHRELAIQASKVGIPYLLSFVGMAEVFGWEPRAPIVAKCDRNRILSSWAPCCGNIAPAEFQLEFSSVRHLTPRQFVEKLSVELGVCGVVAGKL
uniref:Uncharacterized protein MANES_04G162800 n=1 Tax=Rhizophora mucronata TaxID=61149 RepID=A0A2P2JSZ6_RHIMU